MTTLPPPTGAASPRGLAVPLPHGGGGSLCPVGLPDAAAASTSCIPPLAASAQREGLSPCPTGHLHPDAGRVLDADAAHPRPLALTEAEADRVAIEASYMEDANGGPLSWWVARVLDDIREGRRDRCGRYGVTT